MKLRAVFVSFALALGLSANPASQKFDLRQLLPKNSSGAIGLAELIQKAQQNPKILAQGDAIASKQAQRTSAYLELGPSLSASYSYQYQTTPSRIGKYYGDNSASVTANWEIYSGFSTINKIHQQDALYRASIANKDYSEQNLYLQIIQQYYAYFTNYSNLLSLQQKRKLLQNNVNRLKKLYDSGLTTIDDLESLKAEASLTEYQIAQKELDLEQNRLNLSLLCHSEITEIRRDEMSFPNLEGQKERADIASLREQAEATGYQKRQLSYAPSINLYNTFGYNDSFGDKIPNLSMPKTQNVVGVSVSLKLDSFALFKQKEAVGLAQMQELKELSYKQQEQKKDVELYKKSLHIAKIKIQSAEAGLRSALLTFESVSKRYDAQLVTYVDYLNALSQKITAEATYMESLNDYELQKANFIFYSGQSLEQYIK